MPASKTIKKKSTKKSARATTAKKKDSAAEKEVTIDRRRQTDRRDEETNEETIEAVSPERRQKVQRRRQIDPTTCERDYSVDEVEFMNAMDEYKRTSGRMFPTCSEVLEVIRDLGYVRLAPAELATLRTESVESAEPESAKSELDSTEELEAAGVNGWTV